MEFRQYVRRFRAFSHVARQSLKLGAAVVVGVVVYSKWNGSSILHAAWTTGYEPTVKWDSNWDRRDPRSLVPPSKSGDGDSEFKKQLKAHTPTANRHIILIRHGQYFDNGNNDKERFLTSLGRSQAELTGQRLKDLDLPYTILISSTMTRAIETAEIIHKYLADIDYVTDDSLREGAPIPPEPPLGSWKPEQKFFQDGARIESAFRKYFHRADPGQKEDSYEIIVCHANVIRYFICRALQFPGEAWLRFSLANCSISHVVVRPSGRVTVTGAGDHGHIPGSSISFTIQFPGEAWLRICVANCSITLFTIQPDGLVTLEMMGDHGHIDPETITFH